ncbi:nucleotidyltransferase family protein [Dethiobacter alkaliphilus]|uniref:nucleotidyltransferase family protein n=1 Tax=Dethiobacter alkaliphilus TaxID=427926 RepID=UPI00222661F0|nr:nucleotidyltransferase domain-containing protein [Dethiobacter alkaliphilus]MCW3490403.1 nucleotidyltransferase domain-containing protein [Dethiobacter alkaliphilus]
MEELKYVEMKKTWRERKERNKLKELKRKEDALDKAKMVSDHLKNKYGVEYVYLFGSLIWGKHFTASSDIDLLICGFPDNINYWEVLAAVERMAMPFPISLVLDSTADQGLKEKVMKEGVLL